MSDELQVAVLVENHPYNVMEFQKMLNSFTNCNCYVQPVDLFVQDDTNKEKYDTVLWYNINWEPPKMDGILLKYLENEIGRSKQGIVLIHHALLNFQNWDPYTEICGLKERGANIGFKYTQNETVNEHILDREHPITSGISDFSIIDETYQIGEPEEKGNHLLISTENKTSMHNLAWTRQYNNSRVFCYASGHDEKVYSNENYRNILNKALLWTACRI